MIKQIKKRKLKKKLNSRQKDMSTAKYKNWRKAVILRDKKCAVCGIKRTLNVHHLYPYKSYPNLRYDPNNGALLCHKHHKEFHHTYGNKVTARDFHYYVKTKSSANLQ